MRKKGGIKLQELNILEKNLLTLSAYLTLKVARTIAVIVNDTLAHALPRTPMDTGELRKSGTATVYLGWGRPTIVGRTSNAEPYDTVVADLGRISSRSANFRRMSKIIGNVSFHRMNDSGQDIAVWTHEDLLPYVPRPKPAHLIGVPVATKPYTGPKYLENAWNSRLPEYKRLIQNIVNIYDIESDVAGLSKIRKRKYTQYTVDVVELVQAELDAIGWNKLTLNNQFIF